jgi:hypothetical protein
MAHGIPRSPLIHLYSVIKWLGSSAGGFAFEGRLIALDPCLPLWSVRTLEFTRHFSAFLPHELGR